MTIPGSFSIPSPFGGDHGPTTVGDVFSKNDEDACIVGKTAFETQSYHLIFVK